MYDLRGKKVDEHSTRAGLRTQDSSQLFCCPLWWNCEFKVKKKEEYEALTAGVRLILNKIYIKLKFESVQRSPDKLAFVRSSK